MPTQDIENFLDHFRSALAERTFVKLTLANYKGSEPHLQKILVRLITTKKGERLFIQYRYDTRDIVKNHDIADGFQLLSHLLGSGFRSGHLFTSESDWQLEIGKRSARLNRGRPTFKKPVVERHDREKTVQIDANAYYLKALGITNDLGEVKASARDKWKQINKFIETVDKLFRTSPLKNEKKINIVDMGCGKGYLTFAIYDHFNNRVGIEAVVTGVDTRRDLVEMCNSIAQAGGYDALVFQTGSINDAAIAKTDILIALHACDTATDDAIFKGMAAGAALIIAAPCCHRELRSQIKAPFIYKDILKHGTMLERTAETLTDGLRALLLEKHGYSTKVFEFIAPEHTPKNNMIAAIRRMGKFDTRSVEEQITGLMNEYGIHHQKLHDLLIDRPDAY